MDEEPEIDVGLFLKKIVWSFSAGLVWLIMTMTLGIYHELMIIEKSLSVGNIFFYLWSFITLIALLLYFRKLWRKRN